MANPEFNEDFEEETVEIEGFLKEFPAYLFEPLIEPGVVKLVKILKFIKKNNNDVIKFKKYPDEVLVKIPNIQKMEINWKEIIAYTSGLKLRIHWNPEREIVHLTFTLFDRNIDILFKGYIDIETHYCDLIFSLEPESKVLVY